MEKIIISLKDKYFQQIVNGEKHFEYRKSFKNFKGTIKAYIYVSSPVAKIYSFVLMNEAIRDKIDNILEKITKQDQPSMTQEIKDYLLGPKKNKINGVAIPIHSFTEFGPVDLKYLQKRFGFQPSPTWIEEKEYPELFEYLETISISK